MTGRQRPKIFHLITRLLKGGAEAKTVATVLSLDDYDFTVGHGSSYNREQVDRLEAAGVETTRFPLLRHYDPLTVLPAVASIVRFLRRRDFDIVHTHSTEAGIVGRFAAAIADVPLIVHTVHGVPFTDDRNALLNRFVLGCERVTAGYTDRIITNADAIATEYLELGIGSEERYATVYSGIDLETFREASPAEDLLGGRPRVVMVSRLAEGKGFDVLLDAVEQLSDVGFSVVVVGDGPMYDSIKEEVQRRGLKQKVYLTGYRDDVPRVLKACDVLVLPSYREGTPRVISEAMASGLPVIGTDIAGIPEQIADGESGYLIPTGDAKVLADRLETLLADSSVRERMGAYGSERAERFSVDKMVQDLDGIYRELLSD